MPTGVKQQSRINGNKDVPHGLLMKIIRYDLEVDLKDFFEK